ncbi:MFS transporter [Cupriavidus metallidurans]|uniref:General substrate transporter:Major facilitator superfamily MFS_1 n=2 Tax=Cupriavidus TaxID=106589 RepID=Q1LML2_CUPMC|nr:General substrate transporter:Major facilitator superfamily MFS_1 [Cupriavidus metallidurans CH34]
MHGYRSTLAPMAGAPAKARLSRYYPWLVFALSFGLLLSDYMSRQVLNALFPMLKLEWGLSDTELGALGGVVALMVGVLTFPLSILADRWGRVRSLTLMAALWSLATLGCALANSFGEMFLARLCVGIGEAAYGSVGIAVVVSVFPRHLRASLSAAFIAGGAFGSVLGMGLGGVISAHFGWRVAFGGMALFGLILVALYRLLITEKGLLARRQELGEDVSASQTQAKLELRPLVSALFSTRSILCAYVGSALQLFVMASMLAWLPSYFGRYYGMSGAQAGLTAAAFVLIGGAGMIMCGAFTDWIARHIPARKWIVAIAYSVLCCVLLGAAFQLPPGTAQLVLIGAGMLLAGGTAGPASAAVANLTAPAIHGSAFATLTLVNNLLGLAPGPFFTGLIADHIGLRGALQFLPLVGLLAAVCFVIGRRTYSADVHRLERMRAAAGNR